MNFAKIHLSFSIKCMLFCLSTFILPTLLVFGLLYKEAEKVSYQEAQSFIIANLKNVADSYEEVLKNSNLYHLHPLNDKSFLEYNARISHVDKKQSYSWMEYQTKIQETINSYLMPNREMDSIYLYNTDANIFYSCSFYSKTKRINFENTPDQQSQTILDYIDKTNSQKFAIRRELEGDELVITSSSNINVFNSPDLPIYFSINLDFDKLAQRLVNAVSKQNVQIQVLDSFGNKVELDRQAFMERKELHYNESDTLLTPSENKKWITCAYQGSYSGFTYTVRASMDEFNSSPTLIKQFSYYLFVTLLVILFVILLIISLYIIQPIKKVCAAMNTVEDGNLHTRLEVTRSDEIGYIQVSFNHMLNSVEALIRENYEFQLKKKESELKYIQTQINEHFLYNTLDSIHWIARKYHVSEIDTIIFNLANFYRMTLSEGEELVPICKILQIFNTYLELIQVRLDHKITLTYDVDEKISNALVLKYVFQPVLENAVYHGIAKSTQDGVIHVTFSASPSLDILCTITDNGKGIEPARLQRLQECLTQGEESDKEFFALQNIASQLQLYYGCASYISVESQWQKGCKVTIFMPNSKEALP